MERLCVSCGKKFLKTIGHGLCSSCYRKKYDKEHPEATRRYKRTYREKNKEKIRQYDKEWTAKHPRAKRQTHLKFKYNITLEDYDRLYRKQDGCCAICKQHGDNLKRGLMVDHDHATGRVRGLLCNNCNHSIVILDNPKILAEALRHLDKV